jgi:hypothetical protein
MICIDRWQRLKNVPKMANPCRDWFKGCRQV